MSTKSSLPLLLQLIQQIEQGQAQFNDVIAWIAQHYMVSPTAFKNGHQTNSSAQNQGSAQVLYCAYIHDLDRDHTLALFAEHYRAVLNTPDGQDHQNIRQFMQYGWDGVHFEGKVLTAKPSSSVSNNTNHLS